MATFGLKNDTLSMVQARTEANKIPQWIVSLALIILDTRQWFRMDQAPKGALENLKGFRANDRSNLWTIMRFITGFVADHEHFEKWGDGTKRPEFTRKGLESIYQYGFSTGMVGHVVKILISEGILGEAKKSPLTGEDCVLYAILPSVLSPTSWEDPSSRIGLVDGNKEVCKCTVTEEEILEGDTTSTENHPELPEGTSVLYHQSGLVVNLKLSHAEAGSLMEAAWDEIPWDTIFPGITLVPEPKAPKPRVVHTAPATKLKAAPKVLAPLPEVPEFIQGAVRVALDALACSAVGGPDDEMGIFVEAEAAEAKAQQNVDFLAEELRREQLKLTKAHEARKAAQTALDTCFPARKVAHQKYLDGLKAATDAHKANVALQRTLGIEVEETSPELT